MNGCHRKTLFLTGAPSSSSLQWTEDDLCADLEQWHPSSANPDRSSRVALVDIAPLWRRLPLAQAHLPTGLTQASKEDDFYPNNDDLAGGTSFFGSTDFSSSSADHDRSEGAYALNSISDSEEILSQYYEHSFAVHEDIPSSQIEAAAPIEETSFITESDDYSVNTIADSVMNSQENAVRSRLAAGSLNDLKDIPNPAHLRSICPQTVTANLVVGIISISQPRSIKTRRGGRVVELVELLVGDNTKSGFGINIWLSTAQESDQPPKVKDDLRSSTAQLRPQDIVLARNVALDSFKGKVYGQSLRKDMTTVDLLYRNVIDKEDVRGILQSHDLEDTERDLPLTKVKKVRDWVMHFVGTDTRSTLPESGKLYHMKEKLQTLPSDTPEK